jgi:thiol-disulfide isomerase/thioredoxin
MKRFLLLAIWSLLATFSLAAQQPSVIKGTLTGHDAKPMIKAHVHLSRLVNEEPITTVDVTNDGKFTLTVNETGTYFLNFTGVDHQQIIVPLILDKPVSLNIDVQLKVNSYKNDFSKVRVIGKNIKKEMVKQADGTYLAEIETTEKEIKYRLSNLHKDGRNINGTHSDDYVYDGDGDYYSVIKVVDGKAKIIFDPKKLSSSSSPSKVIFDDPSSTTAKFYQPYKEVEDHKASFYQEYYALSKGEDKKAFFTDWLIWHQSLLKKANEEKDPLVKQFLFISYNNLQANSGMATRTLGSSLMRDIDPTSILWSMNPKWLDNLRPNPEKPNKDNEYINQVLEKHPDPNVKASLLYSQLSLFDMMDKEEKGKVYYDRLVKEFGNTKWAELAKTEYGPDRKIMLGKTVPAFSFASIDMPQKQITSESFKGKFYLIDIWATWCGPCIGEMEYLHKVYEKFKGKNFEMVSISIDGSLEDVTKFRKDKWKLPWFNAFNEGGFKSEAAKLFEVRGIPRTILIDDSGKIVAIGSDLRGEKLESTLSKFLGNIKAEAK